MMGLGGDWTQLRKGYLKHSIQQQNPQKPKSWEDWGKKRTEYATAMGKQEMA